MSLRRTIKTTCMSGVKIETIDNADGSEFPYEAIISGKSSQEIVARSATEELAIKAHDGIVSVANYTHGRSLLTAEDIAKSRADNDAIQMRFLQGRAMRYWNRDQCTPRQSLLKLAVSYVDGRGKRIDRGIIKTVVAFWEYGIETNASCEGHKGFSAPHPWIDVPEKCAAAVQNLINLYASRFHDHKLVVEVWCSGTARFYANGDLKQSQVEVKQFTRFIRNV